MKLAAKRMLDRGIEEDHAQVGRRAATSVASPAQAIGVVQAESLGTFVVHLEGRQVEARRAASCLLVPAPGDTVAWLRDQGDRGYIFAVLERRADAAPQLRLEGGTVLKVEGGDLTLSVERTIKFESHRFEVKNEEVRLVSQRATLVFGVLETFGDICRNTVNQLHQIGRTLNSVFERVMHSAQHSTRFVESVDQLRAGSIDYQAQQLINLQGEHVVTSGARLVKTRGAQIHIG